MSSTFADKKTQKVTVQPGYIHILQLIIIILSIKTFRRYHLEN